MTRIRPAPPGSRAATHAAPRTAPRRRRDDSPYGPSHAGFSAAATVMPPAHLPQEDPTR